MDWFLYDRDLRHERVNEFVYVFWKLNLGIPHNGLFKRAL